MSHTKEGHPLPGRIMHYVNLLSMVLLVATGFFIHKPNFSLFGLDMNTARYLHFIFGFVLMLNALVRVYWAIFGKPRDIRNFLPERENKGTLFPIAAYYLFLRKTHPATSKYNPLQKITYISWAVAILFMGITGFAMLWKTNPFWAWVVEVFGGLNMIHVVHYLLTWFFVVTVLIHAYLSVFEDFRAFLLMFFGIELEEDAH